MWPPAGMRVIWGRFSPVPRANHSTAAPLNGTPQLDAQHPARTLNPATRRDLTK